MSIPNAFQHRTAFKAGSAAVPTNSPIWRPWQDLNPRHPDSKSGALVQAELQGLCLWEIDTLSWIIVQAPKSNKAMRPMSHACASAGTSVPPPQADVASA